MAILTQIELPEGYQEDLARAATILKDAGCTDVYLFGSLSRGQTTLDSDIDLAVRGCPRGKFFYLLGRLLLELDHGVDLVRLDTGDEFADYLMHSGDLIQIA